MIVLKRLRTAPELGDHLNVLYHTISRINPDDVVWSIKPWDDSRVEDLGDWIYAEIRKMYPDKAPEDVDLCSCCILSMRLHILAYLAGNIINGISVTYEDAEIRIKISELAAMLEVFTAVYGWQAVPAHRHEPLRETEHKLWMLYGKLRKTMGEMIDDFI